MEKLLNKEEMNDTYLTHVCRLPQSIQNLEKIEKKKQHCSFCQLYRCTLRGTARGVLGWGEVGGVQMFMPGDYVDWTNL